MSILTTPLLVATVSGDDIIEKRQDPRRSTQGPILRIERYSTQHSVWYATRVPRTFPVDTDVALNQIRDLARAAAAAGERTR